MEAQSVMGSERLGDEFQEIHTTEPDRTGLANYSPGDLTKSFRFPQTLFTHPSSRDNHIFLMD
jgi:hypothetical protein